MDRKNSSINMLKKIFGYGMLKCPYCSAQFNAEMASIAFDLHVHRHEKEKV